MRLFCIALLCATSAFAFDREAWLAKREAFTREAERLQTAYTNTLARIETPAENVSVPLEIHPDGSVKLLVEAKRAQLFMQEALVWGEGVVFREYDVSGREIGSITAGHCLFDRTAKTGWAQGPAKVVRGEVVFNGEDVFFSADEEYLLSFKSSKFDAKDIKVGGVL